MVKEELIEGNPILELEEKMYRLTSGMCTIGPGPYGFGVCNPNQASIELIIMVNPNPYDKPLPPEIKESTVTVEGYSKVTRKLIDEDVALRLSKGSDPATCVLAAALLELSKTPIKASIHEINAAFDYMVTREMAGQDAGLTEDEGRMSGGSTDEMAERDADIPVSDSPCLRQY